MQKKKGGSLLMNREDAASLGIGDGSRVRITSDTGSLETDVKLTDDIISGTACLDCSYSNILTSTEPTLPSGGSRTHSTFIDIKPSKSQNKVWN
jgi:anaerobic dimethyl sulfoxide reductase subunit A